MRSQKLSKENKKELKTMLSFMNHNIPLPEYEKSCNWNKRCNLNCAFCLHLIRGNEVV
jgi:hypothetical protein